MITTAESHRGGDDLITSTSSSNTITAMESAQNYKGRSLLMDKSLFQDDPGALHLLFYGGVLMLLLILLVVQFCRHCIARRRLRKLAGEELDALQHASKDVSARLFPRAGFLSTVFHFQKAKNYASADELQPLLNQIRSPSSPGWKHKYHMDRLSVLGGALWFRFQFHGGFSREDIRTLYQSLTENNEPSSEVSSSLGLPFMKDTVLWALLPQHRDTISHCLEVLAWALRDTEGSTEISAFPNEFLLLMVEEILRGYSGQTQPKEPDLLPDASHDKADDEPDVCSEPLLPRTSKDQTTEAEQDLDATRICGYLHQLNVFTACHEREAGNSEIASNEEDSYFKLRAGILQPKTTLPARDCEWIQPFLTKLALLVGLTKGSSTDSITPPKETDSQLRLQRFVLRNLPAFMIHLRSYKEATRLLLDQLPFAILRIGELGLKDTVHVYLSEWQSLQQCLGLSLLRGLNITKSPVFGSLCVETISKSAELTQPATPDSSDRRQSNDKLDQQQSTASACLELASFALNSATKDPDMAVVRLLHCGRHLQLLVLEARCRLVAKTIHNLALTLHVRECIRKKKRGEPSHELPLSRKFFDLSSQLVEGIAEKCQEYKEGVVCETTMEVLATTLNQLLLKEWIQFQPILDQIKSEIGNSGTTPDGVQFRINRAMEQFQRAREAAKAIADLQLMISQLPCNAQSVRATQQLVHSVETLSMIT